LEEKELQKLMGFVRSSFARTEPKTVVLLEVILTKNRSSEITREEIFEKLFPKQKYNDQQFRLQVSYLTKKVKQFYMLSGLLDNQLNQKLYLLKELQQRNAPAKLIETTTTAISKLLKSHPLRNEDYFLQQYMISVTDAKSFESRRKSLNKLCCLLKLKQTVALMERRKRADIQVQTLFLKDILRAVVVEREWYSEPIFKIYYYTYKTLSTTKSDFYALRLRELLLEHWHTINISEQQFIYRISKSYFVSRYEKERGQYAILLNTHYREELDSGIIPMKGELSPTDFRIIVQLGLQNKEIEWVINFIQTYQRYLPVQLCKDEEYLAMAKTHFTQKNFSKSLKQLNRIESNTNRFVLEIKLLQLAVYVEKKDYEGMHALMHSMRIFLNRNPRKFKSYYRGVRLHLNLLKQWYKMMDSGSAEETKIEAFLNELNKNQPVPQTEWLAEKFTELSKRR
jgi:hypothetical protein